MSEEMRVVYVRGLLLAAEIEMNAMIAENKQREALGQSMAYTDDQFMALIEKYGVSHNAMLSNFFPTDR